MELTGYKHTAGPSGCDFYRDRELLCSIRAASPSLVTVEGCGQSWISEFDPDTTLVPGVARPVLDRETGAEVFRVEYFDRGRYFLRFKGASIWVAADFGAWNFSIGADKIATVTETLRPGLRLAGADEPADGCRAAFFGIFSPKWLLAILSFPTLRFGL